MVNKTTLRYLWSLLTTVDYHLLFKNGAQTECCANIGCIEIPGINPLRVRGYTMPIPISVLGPQPPFTSSLS